jgi:hypothetical protein
MHSLISGNGREIFSTGLCDATVELTLGEMFSVGSHNAIIEEIMGEVFSNPVWR